MCQRILPSVIAIAIVGPLLLTAQPAAATGYWNMPSTFCQCLGFGFGAGHHAPLVLGPITWDGCFAHNEQRLPFTPALPYGDYGYGCAPSGAHFLQPTALPPIQRPSGSPAIPGPISQRPRQLYLR